MGVVALVLNQGWVAAVPIISAETPRFLFGGIFVFLAFVCYGWRLGLLAAVVSVADNLVTLNSAHLVTGLYVLEALAAYALFRRFGSLVLGVTLFWLGPGWILDWILYGTVLGFDLPYLTILFVKQIFNGLLNAVVVDTVCALPFVQGKLGSRGVTPVPLQTYTFNKIIVVALVPALILGLILTRATFGSQLREAVSVANRSADQVREDLTAYLGEVEVGLEQAAHRIVGLGAAADADAAGAVLADLSDERHALFKLAYFDAAGTVVATHPVEDLGGDTIAGISITDQQYYRGVAEKGGTFYAPLMQPTIKVSEDDSPHVVLVAEGLVDTEGTFAGGVVAALHPDSIRPYLHLSVTGMEGSVTVFDQTGQIIASGNPTRSVGQSIFDVVHERDGDPIPDSARAFLSGAPKQFTYYPPNLDDLDPWVRVNVLYASFRTLPESGWGILIDLPASGIHALMAPTGFLIIVTMFLTVGMIYLAVHVLSRGLTHPITAANETAAAIAAGGLTPDGRLEELIAHPVDELRGLGREFAAMREVLARHRASSEARQAETLSDFHAVFDQEAVGILHLSLDGAILRINRKFADLLGVCAPDMVGTRLEDLAHPDEATTAVALREELIQSRSDSCSVERRLRRCDGSYVWLHTTESLVYDLGGSPKYVSIVAQDVTATKELEEQLEQSRRLESVGLLAGGVAHDFNNLLTPILGFAELAMPEVEGNEDARTALEHIQDAAVRAKDLVWQLLAFGRKQILELKLLAVVDVVKDCEPLIRVALRENVGLVLDLPERLGPVRADQTQLRQIIMNLCANAQDAMPHGGTLEIRAWEAAVPEALAKTGTENEGERAVFLSISDTGEGMEEEIRSHVFEPFFTTKEVGRGTGLGLATVYGIVRQHGGIVTVDSNPGKGATFTVVLPRAQGVAKSAPVGSAPEPHRGRGTVLVVEDEDAVRALVDRALQQDGYRVLLAADGESALSLSAGRQVDLLLTDVVLPGMNGRALGERLAVSHRDLRVLFMSGYSDQVFSQGTHLLAKPFTVGELSQKVRTAMEG